MALSNNQKAYLAMVFMQLLYAGMALLSKAALNKGMSCLVFVVYRQATATLAMAPFACIVERKKASSLSLAVFCKIFLLALFGPTLSMDLYYIALRHTTATFASASINVIPAMTFLIAIILRMETVDWRRIYGQSKILGVVLCLGGAVVLSLYQGPSLQILHWHVLLASRPGGSFISFHGEEEMKTLVKGPLLMFLAFVAWSTWVIMQAKMLKDYKAKLSLTTLQCLLSTIQTGVIAVAFDRNLDSWRLGWNLQLISVIYCGLFVSGVSYWLQLWCIEKKGPVYVAMFSPLSVLITAIIAAVVWAELLYLGSILGGVLIIGGLYCVLWGKSKEVRHVSVENVASEAPKDKMVDIETV
ncbi:WAT1-related protein [Cinnamomum micranthum f. kanehirae]|uniref:WAT1-related protein n=1 Tax=Cinnamomum micranthum f. kanehirae TaxID=337451 RepID=A0A3S3QN11_9MAGN|nr:WAT1-related protein [Cinnamomum micranthum f. kanehirae]